MIQDTNYLRLGLYDTKVVGIHDFCGEVVKGEAVDLVRNPLDRGDPNAIKVMNREGKQIGNLPKSVACELASFIDDEWLTVRGVVKWTGVRDKYADAFPLCMTLHVEETRFLQVQFELWKLAIRYESLQGATPTGAAGKELSAATSQACAQVPRTPGIRFTGVLEPEAITGSTFDGFFRPSFTKRGYEWNTELFSYQDVNGTVHDTVQLRNCVLETRNGPNDNLYATSQHGGFIKLHVQESDAEQCFKGIIDAGEFASKFVGTEKKIRYFQDAEFGGANRAEYCVFSPGYNKCRIMKRAVGTKSFDLVNLKDEVRRACVQGLDLQVIVAGRPKVSRKTVANSVNSGRSCEIHVNFNLTQIAIVGDAPKATKYEDPLVATVGSVATGPKFEKSLAEAPIEAFAEKQDSAEPPVTTPCMPPAAASQVASASALSVALAGLATQTQRLSEDLAEMTAQFQRLAATNAQDMPQMRPESAQPHA